MLTTFQVVLPYFERFNNSQKFIVVSLISSFGQNHVMQIVSQPVISAQIIQSQLT